MGQTTNNTNTRNSERWQLQQVRYFEQIQVREERARRLCRDAVQAVPLSYM